MHSAVWLRELRNRIPIRRPDFLRGAPVRTPLLAPALKTSRLMLRPYSMNDAADWFRIQSSPEVLEFLPWPRRSPTASRRHLRHRTRHTRLRYDGDFFALAVTHDGQVIGDISLHLRGTDPMSLGVEIGWLLLPECTGLGYATEAATAVLTLAFQRLGAQWAAAIVHEDNRASLRLAERLGFAPVSRTPEGILRLVRQP